MYLLLLAYRFPICPEKRAVQFLAFSILNNHTVTCLGWSFQNHWLVLLLFDTLSIFSICVILWLRYDIDLYEIIMISA